jgi:hypothetical protein
MTKFGLVATCAAAVLLAGCGGGQDTEAAGYTVDGGIAQKGPLAQGSVVTVDELSSTTLLPTGKEYTFRTLNNLGTFFTTGIAFGSRHLSTLAQGYYFNEITGAQSTDIVVLSGLSQIGTGGDSVINVNALSSMAVNRVIKLATATPKITFAAARAQAQRELLAASYIYNGTGILTGTTVANVAQPANLTALDLSKSRAGDQMLAAMSGVVMTAGANGNGVNTLLSQIAVDLGDDGLLNNSVNYTTSVSSQLCAAAAATDFSIVAANLNRVYGSTYTAANLSQWVDTSGCVDKVINKYKFTATNVAVGTESKSPAYIAGPDDVGQCLSVGSVSTGATAKLYYKGATTAVAAMQKVALGDSLTVGIAATSLGSFAGFIQRSAPSANGACPTTVPASGTARVQKYTVVLGVVLSGVAATGAPMPGARVQVFDMTAAQVCETTTLADGSYSCTLGAGAKAPLTIVASLGEQSLYSAAASAESGTVNITPLTNLIVSRLSPSGDPARFVDEIRKDPTLVDKVKLAARVEEVQTLLKPLMDAVGNASNPISDVFTANGSGHAKVLDALQINIRPDAQGSNIDITVKVKPVDDGSAPMQLSFKSSDLKPAPLTVAIDKTQLVGDGIAAKLAGFLGRATACYAQPLGQRVANVAAGAVSVWGGPSDVSSTECRGLFIDNDPASFKDGGSRVGSSGAFSGLFLDSSTGTRFDRGTMAYQFANGDVMVTFMATAKAGTVSAQTIVLREQGGQLKAVGNQYGYRASVRAFATDREFPLQPQYNWLGSGYNVSIANRIDPATGLPVFKEATVTAPDGTKTLYRPNGGQSNLKVVVPGVSRMAQVQFFAAAWQDAATPGKVSDKEAVYFVSPQRTDEEVRAIPDQGVWTIEFVHEDAAAANVVQKYRTISRALTLGEVRMAKFAQPTDDWRQRLQNNTALKNAGAFVFGATSATAPNVADVSADGMDAWTVPAGALSPSSVTVFGRSKSGVSFDDGQAVAVSARKARITCSPLASNDPHCDTSTGVLQYAQDSYILYLELWALGQRQVEFQKQLNFYKLTP